MADTPYPDAPGVSGSTANIQQALGVGAYTIADSSEGSGTNFGQTVDTTFVRSLIPGAAPTLIGGGLWTSIADFKDKMHTYLSGFDLDTLKTVQPFIPGATDADFVDSPTAATKIMSKFGMHYKLGHDDFNTWVSSVFSPHGTDWEAGKTRTNQITDIFNDLIVTPIDTEIQNIKDWWDNLKAARAAKYEVAKQNWDDYLTNRGVLLAADAGTKAARIEAWQTRKDDNDEIIRDYFHQTYPKGTNSDTAATLVGGLRTWWGAVNDNKLIRKERLGLSALPTTNQAEIGDTVQANTAAATTAAGNASTAIASNQNLTNQIAGSQTGAVPTGATSTDVVYALTNIAQSSIQGQTGPTVVYGATGGGATASANNNCTATWTHSPVAADTVIEIVVKTMYPAPTGNNGTSVSVGGNNAVLITSITNVSGTNCQLLETWRITIPVNSSSLTVVAHVSASGPIKMRCNSFSHYAARVVTATTFMGGLSAGGNSITMTLPASLATRRFLIAASVCMTWSSGGPGVYTSLVGYNVSNAVDSSARWNNLTLTGSEPTGVSAIDSSYAATHAILTATVPTGGSGSISAPLSNSPTRKARYGCYRVCLRERTGLPGGWYPGESGWAGCGYPHPVRGERRAAGARLAACDDGARRSAVFVGWRRGWCSSPGDHSRRHRRPRRSPEGCHTPRRGPWIARRTTNAP